MKRLIDNIVRRLHNSNEHIKAIVKKNFEVVVLVCNAVALFAPIVGASLMITAALYYLRTRKAG